MNLLKITAVLIIVSMLEVSCKKSSSYRTVTLSEAYCVEEIDSTGATRNYVRELDKRVKLIYYSSGTSYIGFPGGERLQMYVGENLVLDDDKLSDGPFIVLKELPENQVKIIFDGLGLTKYTNNFYISYVIADVSDKWY